MWLLLFLVVSLCSADSTTNAPSSSEGLDKNAATTSMPSLEVDGEQSRKILGSSVVTSVSVIMDTGNGSKAVYTDAIGRPVSKPSSPSELASPINLLNPDRYEFYTFDDNGDLVKRLMSLDEIQGIVATGDGDGFNFDSFSSEGFVPEKRVNDVVSNVQNVLKEEMEIHKDPLEAKPLFDTPDVSDSWSMILPAIFGNSGEDIKPEKPIVHVTPDTIMIEPNMVVEKFSPSTVKATTARSTTSKPKTSISTAQLSTTEKIRTNKPSSSTSKPVSVVVDKLRPMINVEIYSNSKSTTPKPISEKDKIVEIKPVEVRPSSTALPSSTAAWRAPPKTTTRKPTTTTKRTTTTVTTTTTEAPKTTVAPLPQHSLPTLAELLNHPVNLIPVKAPSFVDLTTTQEPKEETTTESFRLSTFTIIDEKPETTTEMTTNDPTTKSEELETDLSTLSSEYFTFKNAVKVPTVMKTTSEVPLVQTMEKIPNTSFLEQLLLTSTNIYEINTELASNKIPYNPASSFDNTETTMVEDKTTENVPTTTDQFWIKVEDTTQTPTTLGTNLMNSIEQLLSQAVGSAQQELGNVNDTKIEIVLNTTNTNMTELQAETATLASTLVDNQSEEQTTEPNILTDIVSESLFSDAVGSLLSQIYGADAPGLTTIEPITEQTEKPSTTSSKTTAISNRKTDDDELPPKTTGLSEFTTEVIPTEAQATNLKPFKADLTLEQSELLKPEASTLVVNDPTEATTTVTEETTTESTTVVPTTEAATTTVEPTEFTIRVEETTTLEPTTVSPTTISTIPPTTELLTTLTPESSSSPLPTIIITINEAPAPPKPNKTSPGQGSKWSLVPTVAPHVEQFQPNSTPSHPISTLVDPPAPVDLIPKPLQGFGLEDSTSRLDNDIYQFSQLCNELAFGFWKSITSSISSARSVVVSPFSATSLLAMVFLGARGATSGEMNEILRLDDMVTFNPHLIFKNVTESIKTEEGSGIATSVILRELFSDKSKGRLLGFYKERVRQFYDGHVEEASFKQIGDVIRRRTNMLVKKNTDGKIMDYLRDSSIMANSPLAGVGVNIFQTDCSKASSNGRDGELHFIVLPSIRQRRLIPIPAAVWRTGFLAGYEPSLDATAVALGTEEQVISTIFVIPGQQGIAAPGDGLARLEKRLVESSFKKGAWSRLLRSLIPRPGLEVQIPRFSHRSVINASLALKRMGLNDLFDPDKADLRGLNGVANELHLSDMLQINNFATCGEDSIGDLHHSEMYPATTSMARSARTLLDFQSEQFFYRGEMLDEPRDYQRAFHDPLHDPSYLSLPLSLRPRQARIPDAPRLRFDRPFLYFVRHNPTGLILHMGRFNPRLLP